VSLPGTRFGGGGGRGPAQARSFSNRTPARRSRALRRRLALPAAVSALHSQLSSVVSRGLARRRRRVKSVDCRRA